LTCYSRTDATGRRSNARTESIQSFKALAHPLRIKILDALRDGEFGVNELCSRLGAEQSHLSQQLALLRSRNIVNARKNGNNVFYSVRDPVLFRLLDVAKEIFSNHLRKTHMSELLQEHNSGTLWMPCARDTWWSNEQLF